MTMHARSDGRSAKHRGGIDHKGSNAGDGGVSKIVLFEIALEMKKAGLPKVFIVDVVRAALDFEGISDLMKLWRDEEDQKEKNEIVADIQDMLDACLQKEKIEEFYVK